MTEAVDPTLTVDNNQASFTDPTTGDVQTDLFSGNIYVSWTGIIVPPAGDPLDGLFNPNPILLTVSSDGGESFSPPETVNNTGYGPTLERDSTPQVVALQGRTPDESGLLGDAGISGGSVDVNWVDDGTNQNQLMANTVTPGRTYYYNQPQGGFIPPETTTSFPQTTTQEVNLTSAQIASLDSLSLTVAIQDSKLDYLGLELIAPGGESITLFTNQTVGGVTNTFVGISGANLGIDNGIRGRDDVHRQCRPGHRRHQSIHRRSWGSGTVRRRLSA